MCYVDQADVVGWVTADTLDFGACLFRCVLIGLLREHSSALKGNLSRANIIPHFCSDSRDLNLRSACRTWLSRSVSLAPKAQGPDSVLELPRATDVVVVAPAIRAKATLQPRVGVFAEDFGVLTEVWSVCSQLARGKFCTCQPAQASVSRSVSLMATVLVCG